MIRGALVTGLLTVVLFVIGLSAPIAAQTADESPAVAAYTLTPERIAASSAAVMALIGAVVGGSALARAGRMGTGSGRRRAIAALGLALMGAVIGAVVVLTADGGLGTGNGLAVGRNQATLNMEKLYHIKDILDEISAFIEQVYVVDVCAVGAMYADWLGYGKGVTNYLSVPDLPLDRAGKQFAFPGGTIMNCSTQTRSGIARLPPPFENRRSARPRP